MPLAGSDSKFCVVLGCKNTGLDRKTWNQTRCTLHGMKFQEICGCRPPFVLHQFPDSPKLQDMWLHRIGLPEFEINNSTCICSIHFLDGKPTPRSFFPTLYLQANLDEDELSEDNDDDSETEAEEDPFKSLNNTQQENGDQQNSPKVENDDDNEYITGEQDDADAFGTATKEFSYDDYQSEEEMEMSSIKLSNVRAESGYDEVKEESEKRGKSTIAAGLAEEIPDKTALEDKELQDDEEEVEILYATKSKPLASYDPQAQILQISNPVKYIQECHNRIAQLLAEKEQQKKDYEKYNDKLKLEIKGLKRKLNKSMQKKRSSPGAADSSRFRVVPKTGSNNKIVVIRKDVKLKP